MKRNVIIGIITAGCTILILVLIFTLKFGFSWWTDSENDLLIFFPFWFLLVIYVGYGTSKYYYNQKQLFYKKYANEMATQNIEDKWMVQRKIMVSKLLIILARLFAIMIPFYILAYIDKSQYLDSNIFYIIIFSIIALSCFIAGKYIFFKYKEQTDF